ncbi:MAG: hypothetical protein LH702_37395, partial [Phormidesmis sp. CAN_BIN44]|nr:hypothetical protein [Phormidesmis sp. CAN_BIN44]
IWVPEFAAKKWIQALPMQLTDPELKKFLSDDVQGGIYQKKLYRMPSAPILAGSTTVPIY